MNNIHVFRNLKLPTKENNRYLGRIYAMEFGDFLKIGSSRNLKERIRALRKQCEYVGIVAGDVLFTLPHTNYKENEKKLHGIFTEFRIDDTELFNINIYDFIEEINNLCLEDKSNELEQKATGISEMFISFFTNGKDGKYE